MSALQALVNREPVQRRTAASAFQFSVRAVAASPAAKSCLTHWRERSHRASPTMMQTVMVEGSEKGNLLLYLWNIKLC